MTRKHRLAQVLIVLAVEIRSERDRATACSLPRKRLITDVLISCKRVFDKEGLKGHRDIVCS